MSDTEKDQGPKSTFTTYMAEGDQLYHKGEYLKAIESYTTALTLQPNDKNCLVARSKCYVKMGDPENALLDAEASLKEDKDFFKGLYQKAEALYNLGDFEFALVFYHRGSRLRPGLQQFRLGIQKAQEAIDNSVGNPSSVKLENKGDLSIFHKPLEGKKAKLKGSILPPKKEQQLSRKEPKSEKISRQLLGELHSDKEYLEKLLKDEDLVKDRMRNGEKLQDLIAGCLTYLDTRTEFWRQQKPIYARERDRKLMRQKWARTQTCSVLNTAGYVLKSLEEIDAALSSGNAKGSLKKAREVLKTVQNWSEGKVLNKVEVLGNLHSCIGNALFDMGEMKKALDSHQKDLELAREGNLTDAKSRALDNIGRVYARIGKFPQAIQGSEPRHSSPVILNLILGDQRWEEKIPLAHSALERAWLFHEIGRCYLELQRYAEARDYGSRSLAAADDIGDQKWRLNASVLVAQSEGKLGDYESSVSHFEEALLQASVLQDEPARDAIQKALCKARQHMTESEMKPLT